MLIAYQYSTRSGNQHLRVRQSHFSEPAKLALQRVGSPARWMPAEQAWTYPLTAAAVIALDVAAKALNETIEWKDGLKDFAEQHVKQAAHEHEVRIAIERIIRDGTPLDPYITRTHRDNGEALAPLRHQQISYHWSQRVSGLLLAHDPGLGKSRSAADASGGWYRHGLIRPMTPTMVNGVPGIEGGVLIIAPKTVLKTWMEELRLWQNATGVVVIGSSTRKLRLAATPAHYHITNYQSLKYVVHNRYDGIIIDECHRVANHTTQTMNTLAIAQQTRKKLGLSGTPMANNLESLFYPMLIIDGGKALGSSRTAFLEKYFNTTIEHGGYAQHTPREDAALRIASAMAESTYFVKKEEVLDLPPKTHTPLTLEMTPEQAKYYKQIKNEAIAYIQDATVTVEQASARMMKLLQICQGFALTDTGEGRHFTDAKTEALVEMLTNELRDRKVIVWAYFLYEIQRLVDVLKAKGIPYVRIDGSITSQRVRDADKDRWNSDPTLRVYIRQISMSEGVTLHANDSEVPCFHNVYLGLSYKYVDWVQSQDRIHRIGQKYPCHYQYLLTEDGVDRRVYDIVLEKSQTADTVHKTGKDFYLNLLKR